MRHSGRAAADVRLLRASVFAVVCVLLSAAGHAAAGGGFPRLPVQVAGWLAVMAFAAPLAGRPRPGRGIALGLGAGQFGLHTLFCLAGAMPPAAAAPAAGGRAGVLALADRLRCGGPTHPLTSAQAAALIRDAGLDPAQAASYSPAAAHHMPGMPMTSAPGNLLHLLPSPEMAAAHLLAAAVLGLVLWRGDAALWALLSGPLQTLAPALFVLVPAAVVAHAAHAATRLLAAVRRSLRRHRDGVHARPPTRWAVLATVVRRGPPTAFAAA
ncbi:hypothetical protein [Actinacidiphila epipremni]|uniref:Uncharacterized protein n=1 Tax=Actinacidiphila epipremni TaxID=2053013 RepID=A0ABX0ZQY0_9ACTN|nr:hypothetical protein [Actinacidiphila epipremni]NJP46340.1 hypothetical protein [Actinacidiphila epipremni]